MSRRKYIVRLVGILIVFCVALFSTNNASAVSESEIMDKALKNALNVCTNSKFNYELSIDIGANVFSIVDDNTKYPPLVSVIKHSGEFYMPTNIGNTLGTQPITCYDVLNGKKGFDIRGNSTNLLTGLVSRYGKDASTATPENIGYITDESDDTSRACFSIKYTFNEGNNVTQDETTESLCYPVENGKIASESASVTAGYAVTSLDGSRDARTEGGLRIIASVYGGIAYYWYGPGGEQIYVEPGVSIAGSLTGSLVGLTPAQVETEIRNNLSKVKKDNGTYVMIDPKDVISQTGQISAANSKYVISPDFEVRRNNITAWLAGSVDAFYQNMNFTQEELAYIYSTYIDDARSNGDITIASECNASRDDEDVASFDGGQTWCKVTIIQDNWYAVQQSGQNKFLRGSFSDVLDKAKELAVAGATLDPFVSSNSTSGTLSDTTTENEDPCYNQGVEGMSWLLCPAINNMANAVGNAQEAVLQWMLAIDTDLYDSKDNNGGESATWKAWDMLRTVANTALIVMLIAVIFSQLTGYGIDNYGIKKMLPRLVLMAVLLNLSFIICQLAVDVSNILGAGLDNLFQSVGANVYGGASVGETMTDLVALLFGAVGATGAVAGTVISIAAIASGSGVMLAVILVLTLVVALAAIILFFVMIGMRQVAVVASIALAPLAFACYILPNTQSLFKKWWSIFKAMLIVYPLCGAVHGLSYIIRGIVFGGGNTPFFMAIVAVAAPFLPFFMLPSLLKSTMAALGRVGGALMAVGGAWQNGIRGGRDAVQNSEAYKSAMERGHRNMNLGRAGFQYDRKTGQIKTDANGNPLERKMGRFGRFMAGGDVGMARARAQALRDIDTQNRENELMGSGFSSALAGIREKADSQKVSEYEALLGRGDATVTEDVTDSAGNVTQRTMRVNTGSAESMAAYHMKALEEYAAAARANDQDAMREAMSKVKAAQNVMAKTDKGRTELQKNFEKRLRNGSSADDMLGLSDAASHIMANYGDKFKAVNREAHAMFQDLSTTDLAGETNGTSNVDMIKSRLSAMDASGNITAAGEYAQRGVSKYTAESLANADDEAISRFVKTVSSMDGVLDKEGNNIGEMLRATAYEALQKQQNGTLNIKPEVANQLRTVTGGYIPAPKAGSNEFYIRHENDAMRIGKTTISVTDAAGTTTSFEGYAVPAGFNMGTATAPTLDTATGHYIYKDASDPNGRRAWDATVGRYVNMPPTGTS